jgi:hypothetical protein
LRRDINAEGHKVLIMYLLVPILEAKNRNIIKEVACLPNLEVNVTNSPAVR